MPLFCCRFKWVVTSLLLGTLLPAMAMAKPDLQRKIGVTVADTGARDYRFSDLRLDSADGKRHYRIRIAQPNQAPPAQGYPVVYFLDGNAVLMELNTKLLSRLAAGAHPPLLVMLGYDNDLRIDAPSRAYDYTPQPPQEAQQKPVPMPHWPNGGADEFLQLIEQRIKPAVAAQVAVDPQRQTLWGHSYGGVFVLHTLFNQPQAFQRYIAVEPSLWWGNGFILKEAQAFMQQRPALRVQLALWEGTRRQQQRASGDAPPGAGNASPSEGTQQLAQRLSTLNGLRVNYHAWPQQGHGGMLAAAVAPALLEASE